MSNYPTQRASRVDGGRLWAAGVATAVVAALIAVIGILVSRGLLHIAIVSPRGDGVWGNAHTVTYAVVSGVIALAATGVLHFLLVTTPRATVFFGWIMVLLTLAAVLVPLTTMSTKVEMIATIVLDLLIGLVITGLLVGAAHGSRVRSRGRYPEPAYETHEWYGR